MMTDSGVAVWLNKAQYDDAESLYYQRPTEGSSILQQISRARKHITNSIDALTHVGPDKALAEKFEKLQNENRELKNVMEDLKNLVITLSDDINNLEGNEGKSLSSGT